MIDALQRQHAQVIQGIGHPPSVQLAASRESAPDRHDLQVDQARGGQVLTAQPREKVVSVRPVVQQGDRQDTGIWVTAWGDTLRGRSSRTREPDSRCLGLYTGGPGATGNAMASDRSRLRSCGPVFASLVA